MAEARLETTGRAVMPYLAVLIAGILVIAFVPAVTSVLPHLVQGY